jgi:hypothetical protein
MATKTKQSRKERSAEIESKLRSLSFNQQDIAMRHLWGQMTSRASNGMSTPASATFTALTSALAYAATRSRS